MSSDSSRSRWSDLPVKHRCRVVASASARLCDVSQDLIDACTSEQRVDPVETITSEMLPLSAALRFIGRRGPRILKPRRLGMRDRPAWLWGVRTRIERQPHGNVLVLGTWNYPLLLPGVQVAQGLAAGNRVQLKPAPGTESASEILVDCFHRGGVPTSQLQLLSSSTQAAIEAVDQGPDLIVLTGAAETGGKVLGAAAKHLSACIMELSGCDAVIALPGFDLERLTDALRFGLLFNGGATCIGPRRLLIQNDDAAVVIERLKEKLSGEPPVIVHPSARDTVANEIVAAIQTGASDVIGRFDESELRESGRLAPVVLRGVDAKDSIAQADLFAPVVSVIELEGVDDAIQVVNECPYRLAASVFGPSAEARRMAVRLNVGSISINDLIVPTADPRVPFGGRGRSGFGVTRGAEGLLAMTTPRAVSTRAGRFAAHLQPRQLGDEEILHGLLHFSSSRGLQKRLAGLRRIVDGVKKSRHKPPDD